MTSELKCKLDQLIELCMKHGKDNLNPMQCDVCKEIIKLREELSK